MKKFLAILLLATTSLFGQHITGDGTSGDPWTIWQAAHFDSMAIKGVANTDYWQLGQDIDWSGYGVWDTPINDFECILDGQGFTMSNLTLGYSGTTTRYTGLAH